MNVETITFICTTILTGLAAVFGWVKWWYEIRKTNAEKAEKEKEKAAKEKAEKELKEIKRRGDAPFLEVSNASFQMLYHARNGSEVRVWNCSNGNVLSFCRDEIADNLPVGQPIILVVANTGKGARSVTVKLDGKEIPLKQEIDFGDAQGLQFLEYPYEPTKRGQEQTITISFESETGVHDTHKYLTKHGFRVLRRIDPELPK